MYSLTSLNDKLLAELVCIPHWFPSLIQPVPYSPDNQYYFLNFKLVSHVVLYTFITGRYVTH